MSNRIKRKYDITCVGELLIDLISNDYAETLEAVQQFRKFQGGSAANLSQNMARLGNQVALVATVGDDAMGRFLKTQIEEAAVHTPYIHTSAEPSTLILVTQTKFDAQFEPYRGADKEITPAQVTDELLENTTIFHTTCFALSLEPAQSTIINAARRAAQLGCQLSIDVNYAQKLWQNRAQAQAIIKEYCGYGAIVKCSEVDWERIYEQPFESAEIAAKHFIKLGAKQVCITLGEEGCLGMSRDKVAYFLPTRKVKVLDSTGAGDAFWSGYLTAWLDGKTVIDCMKSGRSMAEIKLSRVGQIKEVLDAKTLLMNV